MMTSHVQLSILLLAAAHGLAAAGGQSDSAHLDSIGAASARLLRFASAGSRRSPPTRHASQPEPSAGRSGTFKVLRRRKVVPRTRRQGVTTPTERTLGDYLEPTYLALLNDSHFRRQPEFLLAQGVVGESQTQPFRGFGRKLEHKLEHKLARSETVAAGSARSLVVARAGRPRAAAPPPPSPQSIAPRVAVRRRKVRVGVADVAREDAVVGDVRVGAADDGTTTEAAIRAVVTGTAGKSPVRGDAHTTEVYTRQKINATHPEPSATTSSSPSSPSSTRATTTPSPSSTTSTTTERPAGSSAKPSQSTTESSTNVSKSSSTSITTTLSTSPTGKPSTAAAAVATAATPARGSARFKLKDIWRVASERRTPAVDAAVNGSSQPEGSPQTSSQTQESSKTSPDASVDVDADVRTSTSTQSSSRTDGQRQGTAAPVPVRRPPSALMRNRLSRYRSQLQLARNRASRPVQGSTVKAERRPPQPSTEDQEEHEVQKVLGLLDRIRNRSRTPPSFITGRLTQTGGTAGVSSVTTTLSPSSSSTDGSPVDALSPAVAKSSQASDTSPGSGLPASTTARSVHSRKSDAPSSTSSKSAAGVAATASERSPEASATERAHTNTITRTSTESTTVERRRRLESLRRTALSENKASPNLLARRLQERHNIFSIFGGQRGRAAARSGAATRPSLPAGLLPTITPFPILLSTLPAPLRSGVITAPPYRRNFTVSVAYPSTTRRTVRTGGAAQGDERDAEGGGRDEPVRRVLGTSLRTSVSVAVSSLEFKLRKRVSLSHAKAWLAAGGRRRNPSGSSTKQAPATSSERTPQATRQLGQTNSSASNDASSTTSSTERSAGEAGTTAQTFSSSSEQGFDLFTDRAPQVRTSPRRPSSSSDTPDASTKSPTPLRWQEEDVLIQHTLDADTVSTSPSPMQISVVSDSGLSGADVVTDVEDITDSDDRPKSSGTAVFAEEVLLVEEEEEERRGEERPLYLVSLLFVLPVVLVALWYLKKNHAEMQQLVPKRLKSLLRTDTPDGIREDLYTATTEDSTSKVAAFLIQDTLARRRKWEHNRHDLRLHNVLGEGHFGQVWRAEADNVKGHDGTQLVAVKNVKVNATAKDKQDLLRELRIMQNLGSHPNVVTLLGCCTDEDPVLVIMEYVVFGKLLTYLRENRGRHNYYNVSHDSAVLTSRDLTLFACQVAAGMEFVASQGIVHRDLAARNILVGQNKVCRVSDFGMSRRLRQISTEVFEQKHRGALPIRWMSPESLYHNSFDQKSDCWSFGILLWEIITLGSTPYPGLSAREVMRSVREGYRLERPDHCHPQLYQLATGCWSAEPDWRPTFSELRSDLEVLLEDESQGYVDLDRFQEEIYGTLHKSSDEKV